MKLVFFKNNFGVIPTLWWRLPENSQEDENADIQKFRGYGNVALRYIYNDVESYLVWNIARKVGFEFGLSVPFKHSLRFVLKANQGYGHSMLDYSNYTKRLSIGISLSDPFQKFAQSFNAESF